MRAYMRSSAAGGGSRVGGVNEASTDTPLRTATTDFRVVSSE